MYHPPQDKLDPTDWSVSTESMFMVPGDASLDFLDTKKIKVLENGDETPDQCQEPRIRICKYCNREFKSVKALGGHLRTHSQHQAKSKAGIRHMNNNGLTGENCPEDEDDNSFTCFLCDDSFPSMKLFCQHMRNHRQKDPNGSPQPKRSQESSSSTEPETSVEEGIGNVSPGNNQNQGSSIDLLKVISNWSETGIRGRKRTFSDKIDNKIYNAVPLRVYYGPEVPLSERRLQNKQDSSQTEETMPNQDASMESESGPAGSYETDSESTIELLGNSQKAKRIKISMMPQGLESHISVKSKSRSRKLKNPKRAEAVKSGHQCEICGRMFQTGQALGGHKTYHRVRAEELSGEADPSEESDQEVAKRVLDFDLNIPYKG